MKIPIRVEWSKVYKIYLMSFPFFSILFLEMGLIILNQVFKISIYFYFLPIILALVYILYMIFIKDFLAFSRMIPNYLAFSMIVTNLIISYYFICIALEHEGIIRVFVFSFMGLFYGTFLWDFFMGITYYKYVLNLRKTDINKYIKKNGNQLISISSTKPLSILTELKEAPNSFFLKIVLIFSLPLVFLGKTGAYFFGVWLSNAFDIHIFLLSIIFWIASLTMLMAGGLVFHLMAFWKLKYPTQEEIEAYKAEGKVQCQEF